MRNRGSKANPAMAKQIINASLLSSSNPASRIIPVLPPLCVTIVESSCMRSVASLSRRSPICIEELVLDIFFEPTRIVDSVGVRECV